MTVIYVHLLYIIYPSLINIGSNRDCFGHFGDTNPHFFGVTKRQFDPHVWAMFISISRFFGRSVVIPLVNFAHTQLGVPLLRTSFLEKQLSPRAVEMHRHLSSSMARKAMDFCVNIKRHTPRILVEHGFKSDFAE